MNDHLSDDDLQHFRSGAMSRSRIGGAARHLAACDVCAHRGAKLVSPASESLSAAVAGTAEHPQDDAVAGFIAGTLGREQRRAVETHLSLCSVCHAEIAALRDDVQRDFRLRGRRRFSAVVAAAIAAAIAIAVIAVVLSRRPAAPPPRVAPVANAPQATPRGTATNVVVAEALAGGVRRPPYFDELRPRADVERNDTVHTTAAANGAMSPAGVVVESRTPRFAWTADGNGYDVTILDDDRVVARSGRIATRQWTPSQPLERGVMYEWQVTIYDSATRVIPSPPAPPAFFRVVDEASLRALDEARQASPADPLLVGVLYARAGMQREAEEQLSQYTAAHPDNDAAQQLLESIQRW